VDANYIRALRNHLDVRGIECQLGLSEEEIAAAEDRYGLRFPPDLGALLLNFLPSGSRFPNWRDLESDFITERLGWPASGICFDIEHNNFWFTA
jgi:hypothetical protein